MIRRFDSVERGLKLNETKIRATARLDDKFAIHSDDDTLTAEDMALGYKQLMVVEGAWRTLKSGLATRPVDHWAPHRIHAHIGITVLSLLLQRVAERRCEDTWRNIRDDLEQVKLAQLSGPNASSDRSPSPTSQSASV